MTCWGTTGATGCTGALDFSRFSSACLTLWEQFHILSASHNLQLGDLGVLSKRVKTTCDFIHPSNKVACVCVYLYVNIYYILQTITDLFGATEICKHLTKVF